MKKGKKELYLKNEQALEDFLLESAAENLRAVGRQGGAVEGDALRRRWARRRCATSSCSQQIEKKGDARIVDACAKASAS